MAASPNEIWLLFSCCFHQTPSPSRRRHKRLHIDRSMIGNPTNFVHTAHIGSTDIELSTNHLDALQNQMRSKGGYEMTAQPLQAC
ncbi:CDC42 small effector protein homolog [Condylostylus longicornis]|uniref:CDC42 small effector protein homolog n=1 Tax=Condylostylus longicornis TaxID=2530218 RepID=UPI00244DBB7F|nr:CDC42 small effector protein homolog [Condylostylus longicornis]